ncbi:MAG: CRTAC1 family protein [Verrucomicrobia bacterium]|nr:MAG: CRTAC1 family protein [Verrucomicrobiota bacterium]
MRTFSFLIVVTFAPLLSAQIASPPASTLSVSQDPVASRSLTDLSPVLNFRDVGGPAGLNTIPHSSPERRYIVETMGGGGIALLDCDNDGKLDIAVVNDSTIERFLAGGDPMITLYRQDGGGGDLHFSDVTASAGLTTRGWGMGIAVGDYDNDGLPDLYVTGYGHNVLYRNLGGCKFEDVTERAGVKAGGFSTGAAWADYDRDGHIDLFVARYVHTDLHSLPAPDPRVEGYRSVILQMPDQMEGETDFLFRNRGDRTFEDVSRKAGVDNAGKLHGMAVVWGDFDGDGWPDLYVTNDGGTNYLFHNNGDGTFGENGILSGTATGAHGEIYGNMAADFGDFNHDGRLDLVTTRYSRQPASLYRNDQSIFTDVAAEYGVMQPTIAPVKWGVGFGDFDNDGWPDLLIANGNFSSQMDKLETEVKFREPLQLFRNIGGRRFEEIADKAGLNNGPLQSRRGTAFGDIDNDGNLDFVVFNAAGPPSLFLNQTRNANHRVLFRLVGTKSNRMGIGSRVTVSTGTMEQLDEVRGGGSYNSSNDTRLHFGLGQAATMSKVEVLWPSGRKQEFLNVPADAIYEINEERGLHKLMSLPAPSK